MSTSQCIFCGMAQDSAHESPIYRDDQVFVVRDINPKAAVHLLIIPNLHLASLAYQAAWHVSEGLPAQREVSVAKAWVSAAYERVCATAHQSHGAIGFTKEHDLQLYTRRAKVQEMTLPL